MQSSETPSTLRQKVTSKGGTTAAALGVLEQKQWQGILEEALAAAKERGVQMAKELGST
jgi:pyrroline-5-carboxylate reductase